MPLKRTKRRTITDETSLTITGEALIAILKKAGELEDSDNVDDIYVEVPGQAGRQLSLLGDVDLMVTVLEEVSVEETEGEDGEFNVDLE